MSYYIVILCRSTCYLDSYSSFRVAWSLLDGPSHRLCDVARLRGLSTLRPCSSLCSSVFALRRVLRDGLYYYIGIVIYHYIVILLYYIIICLRCDVIILYDYIIWVLHAGHSFSSVIVISNVETGEQ